MEDIKNIDFLEKLDFELTDNMFTGDPISGKWRRSKIVEFFARLGITVTVSGTQTVFAGKIQVGSGVPSPANQQLISANGLRVDVQGAGEEVSFVGNALSEILKIHDERTGLGEAAMYVKHDGGGGSIKFQRTISGTPETGGLIGLLGSVIGSATNQDDMVIAGSLVGPGSSTGGVRVFAKSNVEVVAFRAEDAFIDGAGAPIVMVGVSGGVGGFTNGDMIFQPRTSANASLIFCTGNGTTEERARIDHNGNFIVAQLTGTGTEDVQVDANGKLLRITSDESTKKDFTVGKGVPGLSFVLKAAKACMSYFYKDDAMNSDQKYWGFSANKVNELFGDNPVFRPYKNKKNDKSSESNTVLGWDQKNMIAPLYKAIEELNAEIEKLKRANQS